MTTTVEKYNVLTDTIRYPNTIEDSIQSMAAEKLKSMKLPSRRDEDWKFTYIRPHVNRPMTVGTNVDLTEAETLVSAQFKNGYAGRLVFVNGRFQAGLSSIPTAIKVTSASQMPEQPLVHQVLGSDLVFPMMNMAHALDPIQINIPKELKLKEPIAIVDLAVNNSQTQLITIPTQLRLEAAAGSQASFLHYSEQIGPGQAYFNPLTLCQVAEHATLAYHRIQNLSLATAHEKIGDTLTSHVFVRQAEKSLFNTTTIDIGGRMVRNNLDVTLTGSHTMTKMYGTFIAQASQHVDNQTSIDHALPHCESHELYKNVVTDKASGVFNGKIHVRRDAQKTNAFQKNSSLVLSPDANMDSKPQLMIFADDVKCSHGATIGQFDEESLFYLKSRGISLSDARSLLLKGFILDALTGILDEPIFTLANLLLDQKISSSHGNLNND